jgi:hypothetical protein
MHKLRMHGGTRRPTLHIGRVESRQNFCEATQSQHLLTMRDSSCTVIELIACKGGEEGLTSKFPNSVDPIVTQASVAWLWKQGLVTRFAKEGGAGLNGRVLVALDSLEAIVVDVVAVVILERA